ncbi:thrombospondin type 3 repeat-containing protein [Patescibacteria group bacterium]
MAIDWAKETDSKHVDEKGGDLAGGGPHHPGTRMLYMEKKEISQPKEPKSHKKLYIFIIGIVLGLGIATIILAQVGILPINIPFISNSNAQLLGKMMESIQKIGDNEYENILSLKTTARNNPDTLILEDFSQLIDEDNSFEYNSDIEDMYGGFLTNDAQILFSASGRFQSVDSSPRDGEFTLSLNYSGGGQSYGGTLLGKNVNDVLYLNLESLEIGDLLAGLDFDISSIINKWIKFEQGSAESFGLGLGLDQSIIENEDQTGLVIKYLNIIAPITIEDGFLIIKSTGGENINGVATKHYRFSYNFKKAAKTYKNVTTALAEEFGDESLFEYDQSTYDEISKPNYITAMEQLNKALTIEAWLDNTGLPIRYSTSFSFVPFNNEKFQNLEYVASVIGTTIPVTDGIVVTEPTNSKTFEELFELFIPGFEVSTRDARRQSDVAQLMTALILYYDDNSIYPPSAGRELTGEDIGDYISVVFTPPESESENCPAEDNKYWYQTFKDRYHKESCETSDESCDYFTITFCLEGDVIASEVGKYAWDGNGHNGSLVFDEDNDGLSEFYEQLYGTEENNPDTDADGFNDGEEVHNGYNPNGEGTLQ